jgi:hypothetical protein
MNENMKILEGCLDKGKVGLTSSLREIGQCWNFKNWAESGTMDELEEVGRTYFEKWDGGCVKDT